MSNTDNIYNILFISGTRTINSVILLIRHDEGIILLRKNQHPGAKSF